MIIPDETLAKSGARDRAWTGDLSLTKEVLYRWATWAYPKSYCTVLSNIWYNTTSYYKSLKKKQKKTTGI